MVAVNIFDRFDISRNLLPMKKSEAVKIQECLATNPLYKKIILKEYVPASMWWLNMGKNKTTKKFQPTLAESVRLTSAKGYLINVFNGFVDIPNSHRKSHGMCDFVMIDYITYSLSLFISWQRITRQSSFYLRSIPLRWKIISILIISLVTSFLLMQLMRSFKCLTIA